MLESERFLGSVDTIPQTKQITENVESIKDREGLARVHDLTVPDPSTEGLFLRQKVLVVPGDPDSKITIITPPAWTDGPDTEGRLRITSMLAEITGATVVTPLFPGMGKDGANFTTLSASQRGNPLFGNPEPGSLFAGSYQNVASAQWSAMLAVDVMDENNAGNFLTGDDRKIVLFGHSMGNSGNAGLLATLPEELQVKLAGVISSETPDVRDTSMIEFAEVLIDSAMNPKLKLATWATKWAVRADLARRLNQSAPSSAKYGELNGELDWPRMPENEFYQLLVRDRQALVLGPIAMGKGSLAKDLRASHQSGRTNWPEVPVAIYRGGVRSTTLGHRQDELRDLLVQQAGAEVVTSQVFPCEDHAYADSLVMNLCMVQDALSRFGP